MGKRFIQVLLIATSTFLIYFCGSGMSIAILAMINDDSGQYNWTSRHLSLILNVGNFFMAILMLPSNYLLKFFNLRTIVFSSLFGMGVSFLCVPFIAPFGWWYVFINEIVGGIFAAAYLPYAVNTVAKWSPVTERTRLGNAFSHCGLGVVHSCSIPIGGIVGSSVSGIIAEKLGWQYIFILFGIIVCIWSIIVSFILIDCPANHPTISDKEKAMYPSVNEIDSSKFLHPPWSKMLTAPAVWGLTVSTISSEWSQMTLNVQLPLFLSAVLKIDLSKTGFLASLPPVTTWLGAFIFSWIADYLIKFGTPISMVRRIFNTIGLWGQATIVILLSNTEVHEVKYIFFLIVLASSVHAASYSGYRINHIDISPNFAGSTKSLELFIASPNAALMPIIWGELVKNVKDLNQWQNSFMLTAIILYIANGIFLITAKGKPQGWDYIEPRKEKPAKTAVTT